MAYEKLWDYRGGILSDQDLSDHFAPDTLPPFPFFTDSYESQFH